MSDSIPSRDSNPPEHAARNMLQGVHTWIWPRKPLPSAKPGGKGGKPGGPKPNFKAPNRRASRKNPLPGWD